MKYRSKPVEIEAMRLLPEYIFELSEWVGGGNYPECKNAGIDPSDGKFKVKTLEGVMVADVGDWIIKGTMDEFYPCKDEVFRKKYEPV